MHTLHNAVSGFVHSSALVSVLELMFSAVLRFVSLLYASFKN